MKTLRSIVLISLVVLAVIPLHVARADGNSPWSEILNPDGSVINKPFNTLRQNRHSRIPEMLTARDRLTRIASSDGLPTNFDL